MALKRHISLQWRIFLPLLAIIWLMVIVVGVWQWRHGYNSRVERIRSQVDLVNARIISAYNDNVDPGNFLDFIGRYYVENPLYDRIRISAYYDGNLIYKTGEQVVLSDEERVRRKGVSTLPLSNIGDTDDNFYYGVTRSPDRRLIVYTVLPFDNDIHEALRGSMGIYLVLMSVALFATVLVFMLSRRLGGDINTLRRFALRAGADPDFVPTGEVSDDELGDITRQLVRLFNERNSALIKIKREHTVAMHALEEKSRVKRELTNNINHELKTPIGVIKGYIDTIRENPDMDVESRQHFLQKAAEHVDRLVQLMNDLSSITRLEYGAQMINVEPLDFHEVVFQCVSDFETSGLLGDMVFNYDIPTYCRVVGNAALLTAALGNLTKNAVNYSRGTECNLILTGQDDMYYQFAFYDNGIGVKSTSLPHLFDRFFREDSGRSRKKGGTGLGLPIVQNTIEALGGTISASNRDGGGLLFRFTLRKAPEQHS